MQHHLKDQLLRSSSSIALNIGEGNAKSSSKDRKKFFQIAYASLKESLVALELAEIHDLELFNLGDHIGGSLYKLIKK
ncbi:MAG: four helix bundle protein [Oligoflexia bacterium]|nr:four helix bundle protein [Oligoflexia bacterium]